MIILKKKNDNYLFTVDSFASRANKKVNKYYTFYVELDSFGTDVFSRNLKKKIKKFLFIFPNFYYSKCSEES